jgi:hypothetical protein
MTEVSKNSILFEFQTEDREGALYASPDKRRRGHPPYNALASVYLICATAAVPAIIKTDEEKYYFEVGV